MKKSKILAPALAILCLSTAASVTGTVAWFAANNIVSAFGMNVRSASPASLVIANSRANTVNLNREVDFSAGALATLNPCTDKGTDGEGVAETTMDGILKYVTNGDDVDPATGLAESGETLIINGAAGATHFIDYTVYLASAGVAYDGTTPETTKSITVEIDNEVDVTADTHKALSVAFFVAPYSGPDTRGSYVGTLNLAGLDPDANDFTTGLDTLTLLNTSGAGALVIPAAAGGAGVRVDMRIYFDGALLSSAGQAFVYTNLITIDELAISTTFTLI